MKILGIDLGTSSIGMALIDTKKKKIEYTATFTFDSPINKEGASQKSKNAGRTEKRGARRLLSRKKQRKNKLIDLLVDRHMIPLAQEEARQWLKDKEGYLSQHTELQQWLRQNPYQLRAKGIKEKLSLKEIGRAIYHMSQRRGFQSNRKKQLGEKDQKTIYQGYQGPEKDKQDEKAAPLTYQPGIFETQKALKNNATLGDTLYSFLPKEGEKFIQGKPRVLARYTERKMYIEEFDTLWDTQAPFHTQLETLRAQIGGTKQDKKRKGILFYQNPLKSQKHLVGKCTLEPKKTRCLKSHPLFEEFRAYSFVNTIKIKSEIEDLTQEERDKLAKKLLQTKKVAFKTLKKEINKKDTLFNYDQEQEDQKDKDKKITGSPTTASLYKLNFFNRQTKKKQAWELLTHEEKDRIWHALYTYDDPKLLQEHAIKHFQLSQEEDPKKAESEAETFSKIHLTPGYASFSKKAISLTLPFLKQGHPESDAVVLAGISNAFNAHSKETENENKAWNNLTQDLKENLIQKVKELIKETRRQRNSQEKQAPKGGFMPQLKVLLTQAPYHLSEKSLTKLYHHSLKTQDKILTKLPTDNKSIQEIKNLRSPSAVKTLSQLRKAYNTFIPKYGKPDQIHIELARELTQTKKEKEAKEKQQEKEAKVNNEAKSEIEKMGQKATKDNIRKYKLCKECSEICPYTFKNISWEGNEGLFTNTWHSDHIIPRSRTLNDSFSNLIICHADFNTQEKRNLTPYEYFDKNPDKYPDGAHDWNSYLEALKTNTHLDKNNPGKFKRFTATKSPSDDLASRHLNDTRYMSRKAVEFLQQVCPNVQVSKGEITAKLRAAWQFNELLHPLGENLKNRDDHRNHAIDALVIACTNPSHVQKLSKWRSTPQEERENLFFPKPWKGIENDLQEKLDSLLVNYTTQNKVLKTRTTYTKIKDEKTGKLKKIKNKGLAARGQLHEATYYGLRMDPSQAEKAKKLLGYDYTKKKTISEDDKKKLIKKQILRYHIRKSITEIKTKEHVKSIVDKGIQELIIERLEHLGVAKKNQKGDWILPDTLPKNTFYKKEYYIILSDGKPLENIELYDKEAYEKKQKNPQLSLNPEDTQHLPKEKENLTKLKKKKDLDLIVDKNIKKQIEARIESLGGYQGKDKNLIPHHTFYKNVPTLFLPNKRGEPVPIKKVRTVKTINNALKIHHTNRHVEPGNNHCYLIYENAKGKRQGTIISFMEATLLYKQAKKNKVSLQTQILQEKLPKDSTFCFLLHKGDFVLATDTPITKIESQDQAALSKQIYRVKKISKGKIFLLHHATAQFREWKKSQGYTGKKTSDVNHYKYDYEVDKIELVLKDISPSKLQGTQVQIDTLGTISKHPIYELC